MSKIGKKPIVIEEGIEAKIDSGVLELKKGKEIILIKILPYVDADIRDGQIFLTIKNNFKQSRANWGTMGSLIKNGIVGLKEGFNKILEIEGIGYKAIMEGNTLVLNIGYSHQVKVNPPEGVKISVEKNVIKISGISKELVGKIAAEIRSLKKPEPYKGKGIKYRGEIIKRKAGKKVAATAK